MEDYRNKIRTRIRILVAGFILCAATIIAGSVTGRKMGMNISDFIRGFQAGLIGGLGGCFTVMIFFYAQALRNEERLRKMYIAETDERSKSFIKNPVL